MNLFWVTGESSGDRHSARLIEALSDAAPGWKHAGMCGEAMRNAGCEAVADLSEASLMGFTEVVSHLPRMLKLRDRLIGEIAARKPELVVLVDFPDFNLALLSSLRKRLGRSISVLYFVSPQVWAWRRSRAKKMAKMLDAMAVLFPFEVDFYKRHGLETVFFGHPFAGEVKPSAGIEELRERFGLAEGEEAVTLMPGSRAQEVGFHLPVQLEAVELFRRSHPNIKTLVVRANTVDAGLLIQHVGNRQWVQTVDCSAVDAFSVSRAALVKSGTSTIEAALSGVPFAVLYRVSPLTFTLAKMLVHGVKHIAMVNVLAGREVVPERIQSAATPERLAQDLENLRDGPKREEVIEGLREVADLLGEPGGMKRLAEWIVQRFGELS